MKILVTGASGFVGGHLVRRLAQQRPGLIKAMVRRPESCRDLERDGIEVVPGDLTDPESMAAAVLDCDTVYHCAADYRLWTRNPQELYHTNVDGTARLFDACEQAAVQKIVYTSSVAAIGIPKKPDSQGCQIGNEETPVCLDDMIGHYKRSKFLAQEVALRYAQRGMPIVIVNPSTPIGAGDLKPTATGKIIVDFLCGRMPAYVQTGLNLVAVEDVVEGHLLAAQKGAYGRPYILGNQDLSLREILLLLRRLSGVRSPLIPLPYQLVYAIAWLENLISEKLLNREPLVPLEAVKMASKKMFFSSQRAQQELGYQPTRSVESALTEAICWFVEHGYASPPPRYPQLAAKA